MQAGERERGAVTIEATISLTAFLFMFLMIYSLITICRAQAHIQVAIDNTAKEISQYSYLYGMTGIQEAVDAVKESAASDADGINEMIKNVSSIFEGIQKLGDTGATMDISDMDGAISTWNTANGQLTSNVTAAKQSIEAIAQNPQELLLGMARIIGTEVLDVAVSKAIAEPISRALVKKHLKRYNNDTADAFCKSVGIIPGTYLGNRSYFNGLDFSNSTLFAGTSDTITIIVSYKIKLLQLLPVDIEFNITQSAKTLGWMHGDGTGDSRDTGGGAGTPEEKKLAKMETKGSLWNMATLNERVDLIRNLGVKDLKDEGYVGVSSEQYIHAYNQEDNEFVMISSANPLYGLDSMDAIDKEAIKDNLKRLRDSMKSATDNKQTVNIKTKDENGNMKTSEVSCAGDKKLKVILVIPEDEGLKEIYEEAVREMGLDVEFEIQPGHGKAL